LLLDTHIVIWWLEEHLDRLQPSVIESLRDPAAQIVVSSVVVWEIAIKRSVGKLDSEVPDVVDSLAPFDIRWLPISPQHARHVANLPFHHRDPFDRLLVAQAQLEGLPIVTVDPRIRMYDVETIG
jgi:PIN domain nuclease of toxin-antitoxin system